MEITFEVPDEQVPFMLVLLRSLTFVENPRVVTATDDEAAKAAALDTGFDTTDYLLSSPANAERLKQSYEQFDRGEDLKLLGLTQRRSLVGLARGSYRRRGVPV